MASEVASNNVCNESADDVTANHTETSETDLTLGVDVEGLDSLGQNAADPEEQSAAEALTAAQRARIERNRLKARALQDARLVRNPDLASVPSESARVDTGGGFLLESAPAPPPAAPPPPAPLLDPAAMPHCLLCHKRFPHSYLFDTFDYCVCDACRDDEEAHSLMTRTEAKSEFLLKDCDLDARPPPLRCVRRRNPHRGGGDMRLYLRAQLLERAQLVWGSRGGLDAERGRRAEARGRSRLKQTQRRLRALRMDVRSSLYERTAPRHRHSFGPERRAAAGDDDAWERVCTDCGHVEAYEKM